MLLSNKEANLKVEASGISATGNEGKAHLEAHYDFGPKKRKVINKIDAKFKFKEGKIIEHRDHFNVWTWSKQALGAPGLLLGWTPFLKNKIRTQVNGRLDRFVGEVRK